HRNAPSRMLDGSLDEKAMLFDIDRRRLAGRTDGHDGAGTVGDVKVDQPAIRGEVERPAGLHRRNDRDETPCQHDIHPEKVRYFAGSGAGSWQARLPREPPPAYANSGRQRGRPTSTATNGCETLHHRRAVSGDNTLFECDDSQRIARELQQFAWGEQEV